MKKTRDSKCLYYKNGVLSLQGALNPPNYLGLGVFETLRARQLSLGGPYFAGILGLNEHLDRLDQGRKTLNLVSVNKSQVVECLKTALMEFDWKEALDACVRIVAERSHWFLSITPWTPTLSQNGIHLKSIDLERPIPELKSCSAIISVIAREQAVTAGADEALLVDSNGNVREGAWSNVFWVAHDNTIQTPRWGVLPGITREMVFTLAAELGFRFELTDAPLDALYQAKEIFITQATHGIVSAITINSRAIGSGTPGPITQKLRNQYENLFKTKSDILWTTKI